METGDLLVTLFGDGVALDGAGTDGVKGFQFIASFEQCLAFLNRFFPFDDVVELVEFMLKDFQTNFLDACNETATSSEVARVRVMAAAPWAGIGAPYARARRSA